MPTEEVIRRICDTSYEPGHRPGLLKPAKVCLVCYCVAPFMNFEQCLAGNAPPPLATCLKAFCVSWWLYSMGGCSRNLGVLHDLAGDSMRIGGNTPVDRNERRICFLSQL